MFKNVMVYRIAEGWRPSLGDVEAALQGARFVECGATQDKSVGWVSRVARPMGRWSNRLAASGSPS